MIMLERTETEASEESPDGRCGCIIWTPPFCQKLRKFSLMLVSICLCLAFHGVVLSGTLNSSTIHCLETRFGLTQRESVTIVSFRDIGEVLVMIHFAYRGNRYHRLRVVALGLIIIATGCFLFTLPHFLVDYYKVNVNYLDQGCVRFSNRTTKDAVCRDIVFKELNKYKYCFIFSAFIIGIGTAPLYTVGISYLDDNAEPQKFPANVGIVYAVATLGRAIGHITSSSFMQINTDLTGSNPGVRNDSPFWVGAWWLNFLIGGALLIITAFPLSAFPKQLPGTENLHFQDSFSSDVSCQLSFMEQLHALVTNPTFLSISFGSAFEFAILYGLMSTSSIFYVNNFGLSRAEADSLFGKFCLPSSAMSLFTIGYVLKYYKLTTHQLLKLQMIVAIISLPFCACFIFPCGNEDFGRLWAGINQPYPNESFVSGLNNACNKGCSCLQLKTHFLPLCSSNQITYFSPCFAGCNRKTDTGFADCSCVPYRVGDLQNQSQVEIGPCTKTCPNFVLFIVMFTIFILLGVSLQIPFVVNTLRCVPFEQKSFALSVQWMIIRMVGMILGPLILGNALESTCLDWSGSCSGKGICVTYDTNKLRGLIFIFTFIAKGLSVLTLTLGAIFHREDHYYLSTSPSTTLE